MSGASNVLDPVEAAQDDIDRSKRVIASALDDLTHHHSWLEGYHRDERRRAERLKRQETLEALKLRRQRAAWLARCYARTAFVAVCTIALFLARNGAAFLAWIAPRAEALARIIARDTAAALSSSWRTSRVLALRGFDGTARGFAWSVATSDALGVAFRARLSAEAARLYTKAAIRAQPLVQPALKRASTSWTRTRFRSKRLASLLQERLSERRSQIAEAAAAAPPALQQTFTTIAVVTRARARNLAIAQAGTARWSRRSAYRMRAQLSASRTQIAEAAAAVPSVLQRQSAAAVARSRAQLQRLAAATQNFAFAVSASAAAGRTWVGLHTSRALELRRPPKTKQSHALIVRRCTALVRFEPRRTRLPVVRTD